MRLFAGRSVHDMTLIEVYADIWCPFTHVGLRSVVRQRAQLGRDDVIVRVLSWPLELVNGKPLDPITTANHVDDLRTQVAADLFTGFDPEHFPHTTLPALAVAAAAYRQDGQIGETVSLALREALFEKGRDISHPDVLADVASAHGVVSVDTEDHEAVRREWHEGESRGVKGSPHFFCGEINVFCPSLDISTDEEGHLRLRRNIELLNVFLVDCFRERQDPLL